MVRRLAAYILTFQPYNKIIKLILVCAMQTITQIPEQFFKNEIQNYVLVLLDGVTN